MNENNELRVNKWIKNLQECHRGDPADVLKDIFNKYRPSGEEDDARLGAAIHALIESINSEKSFTIEFAYRTYFRVVQCRNAKDDILYAGFLENSLKNRFYILHAILYTEFHKQIPYDDLQRLVFDSFGYATSSHSMSLVGMLRAFNLFVKKYKPAELPITLEQFYFCMECHETGAREETMTLFATYAQDQAKAVDCFQHILTYWPWTNRSKFYLVAIILNTWSFEKLRSICEFDKDDFLQGLRFSLSYKRLFSAGQALARAVSAQNLRDFYLLVVDVLRHGSQCELKNMYSQWYKLILNREDLFEELKCEDASFRGFCNDLDFRGDHYRLIVLLNLFPEKFLKERDFVTDFLISNCFQCCKGSQLFAWKFLVEYFPSFDYERILPFLIVFINHNLVLPCSEFRNTIIAKLIIVFKYLAKLFCLEPTSSTAIRSFFLELQAVFNSGLDSEDYQPLIFSLKMFDTMLKTIFADSCKRITKNYSVNHNQKLAAFLNAEKIFDFATIETSIFARLETSSEYDDARDLIVDILKQLKATNHNAAEKWSQSVCDPRIDTCLLSSYYMKLQSAKENYLQSSFSELRGCLEIYEKDPLLACKSGKHLFGHIKAINEIFLAIPNAAGAEGLYWPLVSSLEEATKMVLRLFNAAADYDENSAASFQVMEESLGLLVEKSECVSTDPAEDQKFVLLSLWNTLRASCELATTLGGILVTSSESNDQHLQLVEKCLNVNVTVLHLCRHKGAIESAGLTLGKLVRSVSKQHGPQTRSYQVLYKSLSVLFGTVDKISTTRRGAGLSIMFNHLLRNDVAQGRPLFRHAIRILLDHSEKKAESALDQQYENFEALVLHYLCVLVKDTELKEAVSEYYDEIMMSAIRRIEDTEWTVRNAALQLFGAIVPKIVGQRQATDTDEPVLWETSEITFLEVEIQLPKTCQYIIDYCDAAKNHEIRSSSAILFLEFLSKVEYLRKGSQDCPLMVSKFRELFWRFLSHKTEKIRKLSGLCVVRSHEFQSDLPSLLFRISEFFFKINNENFLQGLLFVLIDGIHKINCEWKHTIPDVKLDAFLKNLRLAMEEAYVPRPISYYLRSLAIDFLLLAGFSLESQFVKDIVDNGRLEMPSEGKKIGFDLWKEKMSTTFL